VVQLQLQGGDAPAEMPMTSTGPPNRSRNAVACQPARAAMVIPAGECSGRWIRWIRRRKPRASAMMS
jgi:hypothetical protein